MLDTDEKYYFQLEIETRKDLEEERKQEANALTNPTQEELDELMKKYHRQNKKLEQIISALKKQDFQNRTQNNSKISNDEQSRISIPQLQPHDRINFFSMTAEALLEKSAELYFKGYSLNAISGELSVPKSTIRLILIQNGIELRSHSRKHYIPTHENNFHRQPAKRNAPYGYFLLQGKVQVDTREQAIIGIILKFWNDGKSQCAIARLLNQQKIKPRKADKWSPVVIWTIIKRKLKPIKNIKQHPQPGGVGSNPN